MSAVLSRFLDVVHMITPVKSSSLPTSAQKTAPVASCFGGAGAGAHICRVKKGKLNKPQAKPIFKIVIPVMKRIHIKL